MGSVSGGTYESIHEGRFGSFKGVVIRMFKDAARFWVWRLSCWLYICQIKGWPKIST